jgi:hypothetical protein
VPEEIPEPPLTDFADTPPAQGKPWCITLILQVTIYIFVVQLRCRSFMDRVALLRFIDSVSNLSLLTVGGYYYYYNSHDKMMEKEMVTK